MKYLILLLLLLAAGPVSSQFFLNGNARATNDSCYVLTEAQNWQVGSIWNPTKIDLRRSFDLVMRIFLGCSDAGADGIVFGLQPVSTSIGQAGEGIGFGGVQPSLGIEIDTYQNSNQGDPAQDHIAIMRDGNVSHNSPRNLAGPVTALAGVGGNIETCDYFDLRVSWDATLQRLDVYFDCELRLSYTGDILHDIFQGDPFVFWGFTSATGGANNRQEICFSYSTFLDQLDDVVMCPGGQIQLAVSGGVRYEWSPAAGLSDPTSPAPVAAPATTTTYSVKVFDVCQRPFLDTVMVTVAGNPVFFDLGPDTILCAGEVLPLDVTTPTATYAWSDGSTGPVLHVRQAGDYSVTVMRTDTVCISTDKVRVNYRPLPAVNLGPDTSLCLEQQLRLGAVFPEAEASWSTGDRSDSIHITTPGRYTVELTHPCGTVYDEIDVTFEDCRQVFLPNVFSPNSDGINDEFYPLDGGDVQLIHRLQLFDRWGNLIFQAEDILPNVPPDGWDGYVRGRPVQPGVYLWTLDVTFRDGLREQRAGEVVVIR